MVKLSSERTGNEGEHMRFLLLALGLLALDQWSKWLVMSKMIQGESIPLIDGVFHLTYVRNPGAAFGMLLLVEDILIPH